MDVPIYTARTNHLIHDRRLFACEDMLANKGKSIFNGQPLCQFLRDFNLEEYKNLQNEQMCFSNALPKFSAWPLRLCTFGLCPLALSLISQFTSHPQNGSWEKIVLPSTYFCLLSFATVFFLNYQEAYKRDKIKEEFFKQINHNRLNRITSNIEKINLRLLQIAPSDEDNDLTDEDNEAEISQLKMVIDSFSNKKLQWDKKNNVEGNLVDQSQQPGPFLPNGNAPLGPVVKQVLAPANASQAMSNWIVKPWIWIKNGKTSQYETVRSICKYHNLLIRMGVGAIGLTGAYADAYYNGLWLTLKAAILLSRGTIWTLSRGERGYYCQDVTSRDLSVHTRLTLLYSRAIFYDAPLKGFLAPKSLVRDYIRRNMIVSADIAHFNQLVEQVG